MQKLCCGGFLKIQAWEREANFEWRIENSLRYLIPFRFIKRKKARLILSPEIVR